MKRKCTVLWLTLLLGVSISSQVSASPTVSLNLLNTPVVVGDPFQIQVWANGDDIGLDLLSFGFNLSFSNGGVFNYTGYTIESGFDDDMMFTGLDVSGSVFGSIPDDHVLLATLSFSTLTIGTDTINVFGLYDSIFSGLYYELLDPPSLTGYDIAASLSISTSETAPVPEPATFLLMGIGLTGFATIRRRFVR